MKITIVFKNPDAMPDAISSALDGEKERLMETGLSEDEAEAVVEVRTEKAMKVCNRWLKYGEYISIVIDTEEDTATVNLQNHM